MFEEKSALHRARLKYEPPLPPLLLDLAKVEIVEGEKVLRESEMRFLFPETQDQTFLRLKKKEEAGKPASPLRVGVIFSGGPASGGHNVISGLLDALQKLHPKSVLIGFLGGPSGIIDDKKKEITQSLIQEYRNTGGFDLIGSGRTKIEKEEQFKAALATVQKNNLDGLIVIGGDDSNTNAAFLAEYFLKNNVKTQVIGVPKTIDGDLRAEHLEVSFGFDTACKVYGELIGNIARDALSAKKYYHFIKLMGRTASHITLECALSTHPNAALIGEEIAERQTTLSQIVSDLADLICTRAEQGKNYGVILVPEGLIGFIPEMERLIKELSSQTSLENIVEKLSDEGKQTFSFLPGKIQEQLLMEYDAHGNIQVSQIATEDLLLQLVDRELKKRPHYREKFNAINHFLGYEGRSGFPSNFDATYCYALGHVAALLINLGCTSYMATVFNLKSSVDHWQCGGIPLVGMLHVEERKGKRVAVIQKALVDLKGEPFLFFKKHREKWGLEDEYRYPGPMQFWDIDDIVD